MVPIIITIIILIGIILIPFFIQRKSEQKKSYYLLLPEFRELVDNKKANELANILVKWELEQRYKHACTLLQAIEYKGMKFSYEVDAIRNELRIKSGLGPLKGF